MVVKSQLMSLLFLVIGCYGGYKMANKQPQPINEQAIVAELDSYKVKYNELKSKFQLLSDNEIESYINEDDLSLKTEKADAMLAKLLKLFLIDVGLRLQEQSSRLESSQKSYGTASKNLSTKPQSAISAPKCNYTKQTCEKMFGEFKLALESINWKQKESKLSGLSSEGKIDSFLNEVKVDNLFEYLKSSYKPKNNLYSRLIGLFSGDVIFDDGQPALKMEFQLKNDLEYKKGEYYGTYRIQLFRDGKSISNANGDGRLNFLKSYNKKSKGFIINSGRWYFHLYFGPTRQFLFGNVYEKKDVSTYHKVAKVILNRK